MHIRGFEGGKQRLVFNESQHEPAVKGLLASQKKQRKGKGKKNHGRKGGDLAWSQ